MRCNIKKKVVGQVVKGMGGIYTVKTDQGEIFKCFARGKLKRNGEIYIGDTVSVVADKEGIIEEVLPRKSMLVRPYISNIEAIVIVLAPVPKPDMLLVDKLIIGATEQGVDPIICVNKADLDGAEDVLQQVVRDYEDMADIIIISTQTGQGIDTLMDKIRGRYVCLAGQSAVGKSSLVNTICGHQKMKVGDLSKKGERGKNTTRHVEIIELDDGTKIADTCGFSMLEMPLVDPTSLHRYYTDFDEFAVHCKFRSCTHSDEEVCGVKTAVEQGKLSKEKYERYIRLYKDLKRRWEKRYD